MTLTFAAAGSHTSVDSVPWFHGVVAWFDARKGFGIIQPSDGSGPVFIEFSRIDGCGYRVLSQGQQVLFTRDVDGRHSEAALACPAGNLRHETWLDSTT